ncbi:MAG: hypothetical protein HYV37_00520 [Candidatus Levyibacteriota bacterium]|nr:MAG: hypothetical protein HYV37_00520 [Candidatus Levybacteria bacterium]
MEREVRLGSQAFDVEKERVYGNKQIRDDLVSYLDEYRLQVSKHGFEFQYSGYKVKDIYSGEPMSVKTKRTLAERRAKGLPIHRELAEDAGIESLDEQLAYAKEGDRIFWMSPPGPKEDGYGNYGFVFEGRVVGERLFMTANRIEKPTIAQCNKAFFELTRDNVGYINPEGFLANPRVVRNSMVDADFILQRNFSFAVDQKEALINKQVIAEMDSMIDEFVGVVKTGTREEKITAFHALENYALELKKRLMHKAEARENDNIIFMSEYRDHRYLADILNVYGYMPPIVAGSCGPTGEETKSNDLFADNFKDLMKAIFGDLKEMFGIDEESYSFDKSGTCVRCKNEGMLGPCNLCQGCDSYLRLQAA